MGNTLAYKILENHLIEGKLAPGEEIKIKIDQTLTQDSTGTMVYLQLEALDIEKVKTELSVAYVDHNTLQTGFENADDHEFIKSVARRHGILFSKPGNGICHQLHLENYGIPGKTLLGSDSHTPTGGGIGMIAIGAGGLDVAVAMAKGTYSLTAPKVIEIRLKGKLQTLGVGKGHHTLCAAEAFGKGRSRKNCRIYRRGCKNTFSSRSCHNYKYGSRTRSDHIGVPER